MPHNPNCDGDRCHQDSGEVRVLPTVGSSNAILCRSCFVHEISFRADRNFDLPRWTDLKVYDPS